MAPGFKTGGRKKGSKNKKKLVAELTHDVTVQAVQNGETPLEYMLRVMRDQLQDYDRRDKMAKAAAPYVHAQLAATTLDVTDKRDYEGKTAAELKAEIMKEIEDLGLVPAEVLPPAGVGNGVANRPIANGKNGTQH